MRVTGGDMRGRVIRVADVPGLRPTPSKVRQAMFNILGSVDGFSMLDLFSGSGIMAVEAMSRGARQAISMEQHRGAVQAMQQARAMLQLEDIWRIESVRVERGLKALAGSSFDLIFADPPYAAGYLERLPALLHEHEIHCGQLVMEESARVCPVWPSGWLCQQSRRYGDSCLHFLQPTQ